MRRLLILGIATLLVASLVPPSIALSHGDLSVEIGKAPVTPDGTAAGEITDFVLTFADIDPAVDGIDLRAGGTVAARLPAGFVDLNDGTDNTAIILQGWPQSPPFPFIWETNVSGNTVTAILTEDYLVGSFGPGPKQLHLLLNSFRNPGPGFYEVGLVVRPDPASPTRLHGTGVVHITPRATPSVELVSVFSGGGPPPPFNNPLFQTVAPGEDSLDVGIYLWGAGSSAANGDFNPLVDVDIAMNGLYRGRLVQHDRTVGHIEISAPVGADEFTFEIDGPSVLGLTAVTAFEVGLMVGRLSTDPDVTGEYRVTLSLIGGNHKTIRVVAQ